MILKAWSSKPFLKIGRRTIEVLGHIGLGAALRKRECV
jgi:hypothetical protein